MARLPAFLAAGVEFVAPPNAGHAKTPHYVASLWPRLPRLFEKTPQSPFNSEEERRGCTKYILYHQSPHHHPWHWPLSAGRAAAARTAAVTIRVSNVGLCGARGPLLVLKWDPCIDISRLIYLRLTIIHRSSSGVGVDWTQSSAGSQPGHPYSIIREGLRCHPSKLSWMLRSRAKAGIDTNANGANVDGPEAAVAANTTKDTSETVAQAAGQEGLVVAGLSRGESRLTSNGGKR